MSVALRVSEAAVLALHAMALLGSRSGERVAAGEMAETLGVSEAHLAKVLPRLVQAGLVRSTRGPGGGFVLARRPEQINLLEVYEAIEGPLTEVECLLEAQVCGGDCIFGGLLTEVNNLVRTHLQKRTLRARPCDFGDKPVASRRRNVTNTVGRS